jgi:hypothetical protein
VTPTPTWDGQTLRLQALALPDLALVRLAAHAPAEAREPAEVVGVLDLLGRRVAMDDDRLVPHERAAPLVVPPEVRS